MDRRAPALILTITFGSVVAMALVPWHRRLTPGGTYGAASAVILVLFVGMVLLAELRSGG